MRNGRLQEVNFGNIIMGVLKKVHHARGKPWKIRLSSCFSKALLFQYPCDYLMGLSVGIV